MGDWEGETAYLEQRGLVEVGEAILGDGVGFRSIRTPAQVHNSFRRMLSSLWVAAFSRDKKSTVAQRLPLAVPSRDSSPFLQPLPASHLFLATLMSF